MVLIDDSLVRGTTANKVVRMIFEAGATEFIWEFLPRQLNTLIFMGLIRQTIVSYWHRPHNLEEMTKSLAQPHYFS